MHAAGARRHRHGGYEAVAALGQRLDEARLAGVVAEHLAQIQHVGTEDLGLDVGFRPESVEKLVVGDEAAGMLDQVTQDHEGPGRQSDLRSAGPQALIRGIETKTCKLLHQAGPLAGTRAPIRICNHPSIVEALEDHCIFNDWLATG